MYELRNGHASLWVDVLYPLHDNQLAGHGQAVIKDSVKRRRRRRAQANSGRAVLGFARLRTSSQSHRGHSLDSGFWVATVAPKVGHGPGVVVESTHTPFNRLKRLQQPTGQYADGLGQFLVRHSHSRIRSSVSLDGVDSNRT